MISKASSSTPTMSPGVRLLFKTVQAILPSTTVTVVAASGMAATFHVAYPGSRPLSDVRKMARELKAGLREHLITAYPKISPGGANGIMIDVTALRLVSSVSVITDRLVHTD